MKAFLRKTISTVVLGSIVTILIPLGVSAHWNKAADNTWSYTEGNQIVRDWKNISGVWYYFNSIGKMNTGWISDNGTWYYNNNSGEMQKGWIKNNNNWYYLNNSGAMQTNWVNVNGIWYYFDSTGAMRTSWIKDNDKWYYTDSEGKMKTGTVNVNGNTYYFNTSGELQTYNLSDQTTSNNNEDTTVDISGLAKLPKNYSISVQATTETKILELMNQKRIETGLIPLTMDSTLLQVARYKSDHMIQYNYFDHTTPDGSKWTSWLKTIGYKYTSTGENIAYNNYDAVELFNQWWNSPGHRANMMNPSYNKVGIGVLNGNGKYMGTQEFSN